jgi:response regulator NasT
MADKILICEDAGFVREILRHALLELGYNVVGEACDGNEAVVECLRLKPDIVFLDLVLPLKNGAEAAKDILAERPGTIVIAMSTAQEDFLQERARQAGCVAWLAKPFTKSQLKEILSRFSNRTIEVQNG